MASPYQPSSSPELADPSSNPVAQPLDVASPTLDLGFELTSARHHEETLSFYRELDNIVDQTPGGRFIELTEANLKRALRVNFAFKTCSNLALAQGILETHRYSVCHPRLPLPEDAKSFDMPENLTGARGRLRRSAEDVYMDRENSFNRDEVNHYSPTPIPGTEDNFKRLLRTLRAVTLSSDYHTSSPEAGRRPIPYAAWILGSRPAAEDGKQEYLAGMLKVGYMGNGAENYDNVYGDWDRSQHVGMRQGNFMKLANDAVEYLRPKDPAIQNLQNLVRSVSQRQHNSFGFVTFTGPNPLPHLAPSAESLSSLHLTDRGPMRFNLRPQSIVEASLPEGIAEISAPQYAELKDETMLYFGVAEGLARLSTDLGLEQIFARKTLRWREARLAANQFTHEQSVWGSARIPASCEFPSTE